MQTAAGTPLYAAPEVLDIYNQIRRGETPVKPFHSSCDVWSAGWILFEMLFGCKPIEPRGLSEEQFIEKVRTLDFSWPQDGAFLVCWYSHALLFSLSSVMSRCWQILSLLHGLTWVGQLN